MVWWEPYTLKEMRWHFGANSRLSSLCKRDRAYWLTRKKLVFDVFVEDYAAHRVMMQFGLRQQVPVLCGHRLQEEEHRHSRQRNRVKGTWKERMAQRVEEWFSAMDDVVQERALYDPASYQGYLEWCKPRTRLRLLPDLADPAPAPIVADPAPAPIVDDTIQVPSRPVQAGGDMSLTLMHDLAEPAPVVDDTRPSRPARGGDDMSLMHKRRLRLLVTPAAADQHRVEITCP